MPTLKPAPKGRLTIPIDADRKAVIARAAASQGTTIGDFVLDTAYGVARVLMVDEQPSSLTKRQVATIFATLDNPPAEKVAAVHKLLSEPTVLDAIG